MEASRMPRVNPPPGRAGEKLIEVFDGVVDPRQLLWTTVSTSVTGVLVFNVASQLFRRIAEPQIAGGYALLAGLLACVGCAAVSTRFVSPKRIVTQESLGDVASAATVEEVLLVAGGSPDMSTASPQAAAEMRRTGIDTVFADAIVGQRTEVASAPHDDVV
jgi:hypothetical protein